MSKFNPGDKVVIISNKNNDPKFKLHKPYSIVFNRSSGLGELVNDNMYSIVINDLNRFYTKNKMEVYIVYDIENGDSSGCVVAEEELISLEIYNSPLYQSLKEDEN